VGGRRAGPSYGAVGDPKQTAMLAELLGLLTGWLGPLIMHTTNKSSDPFVRHHITQALNFHLTVLIAYLVCLPLMFVLVGFPVVPGRRHRVVRVQHPGDDGCQPG